MLPADKNPDSGPDLGINRLKVEGLLRTLLRSILPCCALENRAV